MVIEINSSETNFIQMKLYLFLFSFFLSVGIFTAQEIKWVTLEQADKIQEKKPNKKIFVSFYTDWCGWCKKLENTTLKNPEVVELINTTFIPVKFNAESKEKTSFQVRYQ